MYILYYSILRVRVFSRKNILNCENEHRKVIKWSDYADQFQHNPIKVFIYSFFIKVTLKQLYDMVV